jgi:DNA polymerase III alpha subunit (gram-positive type)
MYFDVETTGLCPIKNGIIQIAAIFEEGGREVERVDIKINPSTYDKPVEIDDVALKINKTKLTDLVTYDKSKDGFEQFLAVLNGLGGMSKIVPIGFNSSTFDIPFLKEWFKDNNRSFGEYFSYKDVDVFAFVKVLKYFKKFETKNDQLKTLCQHFNIPINAHEAMSDIVATKELLKFLKINFYRRI